MQVFKSSLCLKQKTIKVPVTSYAFDQEKKEDSRKKERKHANDQEKKERN